MSALRERLLGFRRHWLLALQDATRWPVAWLPARTDPTDPAPAAAGAAHLPGVGLLVGAAACVVLAIVALPLPDAAAGALAAALLSTMAAMLLTGAAHEQALARWIGRLGPQEGLVAAILGLGLVVATKVALLAVLAGQSAGGVLAALLAGHAVSRFWPLCLDAAAHRHARVVGGLWCLPALLLMLPAGGFAFVLVALVASGLAFLALRHRQRARPDADGPGALQQLCEAAFYLGAAFALRP